MDQSETVGELLFLPLVTRATPQGAGSLRPERTAGWRYHHGRHPNPCVATDHQVPRGQGREGTKSTKTPHYGKGAGGWGLGIIGNTPN